MSAALLLSATLLCQTALAQDPLDLGVLQNEEIQVVQKRLYPKAGASETSVSVGLLPFDAFSIAPKAQFTYGQHLSETRAWELQIGGGWGMKSGAFRELDSPTYGVAPAAYGYVASVTGGMQFAPVYAKMNWAGKQILHHDVFFPVVGGVSVERLLEPDLAGDSLAWSISPTVGFGVGFRIFTPSGRNIRIEVRDDVQYQFRITTNHIKQNVGIHVGFSWMKGDS